MFCDMASLALLKNYFDNLLLNVKVSFIKVIISFCLIQGRARTQSPNNINYAPESFTLVKMTEVKQPEVQWISLALGEPP